MMKRATLAIDHIPSGRSWISKIEEFTEEDFVDQERMCRRFSKGGHITIETESGAFITFPPTLLKKCVVIFKEVK